MPPGRYTDLRAPGTLPSEQRHRQCQIIIVSLKACLFACIKLFWFYGGKYKVIRSFRDSESSTVLL